MADQMQTGTALIAPRPLEPPNLIPIMDGFNGTEGFVGDDSVPPDPPTPASD
jgi:hypothetical protein